MSLAFATVRHRLNKQPQRTGNKGMSPAEIAALAEATRRGDAEFAATH
jgi:hypothetical protein